MLDLQKNTYTKYLLFTSLYFSEGIQLAITTVIVPLFLLDQGINPALTTIAASTVMIPWALKFIFGYLVDTFPKINKKKYTIYGGTSSALALIILGLINPSSNLFLFIVILFLAQCGIGILDVSMDAWAITETKEKQRGKLNGSMMAGFFAGLAIGSALLTYIAEHQSYTTSFISAGIIIISLLIIPWFTTAPPTQKRQKRITKIVSKEFKKRTTLSLAILLPLISINSGIITLAAPLFMNIDLQLTITQIGLITTVFTISRVIGSLVGGSLSDAINRHRTLLFIALASTACSTLFIFITNWTLMTIIYACIGFLNGGLFTVLLATSMDITNKKISALQFSILISLMNAGELSGEFISGPLISSIGFARTFLTSAWIFGPSILFLYYSIKKNYFSK